MNRLIIFLKLELLGDLYWQLHKNKNKKWTYLSIFFQECLMCRNTAIFRFTEFKEYSGVYIVPIILKAYPSQIWKSSQIFITKLPFFASHFPFLAHNTFPFFSLLYFFFFPFAFFPPFLLFSLSCFPPSSFPLRIYKNNAQLWKFPSGVMFWTKWFLHDIKYFRSSQSVSNRHRKITKDPYINLQLASI